jgi:hypothetical protein
MNIKKGGAFCSAFFCAKMINKANAERDTHVITL